MSAANGRLSVDKLMILLQDSDPVVRVHAGFVLGSLQEAALPAMPSLIEMVEAEDLSTRKLAALTLGQMGPLAEEAVPALLEAANDEDDSLVEIATWALEEIDRAELPAAEAA